MHQVHSDETSRAEKRVLWDKIIEDYLSSGEKAAVYCDRHGLKSDHLYYYVSSYRRKHNSAPQFVPVDMEASTSRPSEAIEITSGKVHISLPNDVSLVLLDTVLKRLS